MWPTRTDIGRVAVLTALLLAAMLLPFGPAAAQLGDKPTANYGAAFATALPKAEAGDPRAQVQVGRYYLNGQGVPANPAEAVRWFLAAAEAGRIEGMKWLADMYFAGVGVPQSDADGLDWLTRAALAGDTDARAILGRLYWTGEHAGRDPVAAWAWLTLAAEKTPIPGSAQARRLLPDVEAAMTADQMAEAAALRARLAALEPD